MQRIILAFNQARQRRFDLFDAGLVAQGMTILGWLVKYQQPVLVRTWLQARCYSGRLVPGKTLWDVVAGEKIEGIEITPEIAAIAAEFTLENRETPLLTALRQNDSVALKQLIREGTVMVPPKHQCDRTKPDWAVTKIISMGDVELLEMMLDRGIVTATSCKLCTTMEPPLCAAIMAESTAYYEVLMRYGAEINDDVEFAYMSPSMSMAANPVFHPILRARIASVDLTRRYKVSPECTCVVTIVDAAMRSKCADFVRELLVLGAAQSMEPRSSLRNAIHAKQTDIIPILLAHGATPSVPDMVNVAKQGNVEIFEMLKAACKSRDMAWFASTPVSHVCTKPAPPKVPFQSLVPYPAPKPT